MIKVEVSGNSNKTEKMLKKAKSRAYLKKLNRLGQDGVAALASATPKNTGRTAAAWSYEVTTNTDSAVVSFQNSNVNKGVNIALILQYGHGTGTGGYVPGRDYINPAMKPLVEKLGKEVTMEVMKNS